MHFDSLLFLVCFTIFTVIYYWVPPRIQAYTLLAASVGFYLCFSWVTFVILFLLITLLFYSGKAIQAANEQKGSHTIFLFVLSFIILLMVFAKITQSTYIQNDASLSGHFSSLKFLVPVGISFLAFSGISYLIDIKREKITAEGSVIPFYSFFFFFPKIIQGPIERPATLLQSFKEYHPFDEENVTYGLKQMAWGFFKKVVIADRLSTIVDQVYSNPGNYSSLPLIITTVFFAVQVYADFSGYTDIALGTGRILGFKLTDNFNKPYFATSIKNFWSRWHITLSNWLRDYVFLPLAFYFSGKMKKSYYMFILSEKWIYLFSILITFLVCGLWHGIGLTYIAWGLIFAVYLTIETWTAKLKKRIRKSLGIRYDNPFYKTVKSIFVFLLLCFAWIFFRANNISDALYIINETSKIFLITVNTLLNLGFLRGLFSGLGVTHLELFITGSVVIVLLIAEIWQGIKTSLIDKVNRLPIYKRWTLYYLILTIILYFGSFNSNQSFIYEQF